MALPVIRAVGATAKVAGRKAASAVADTAKSAFVDPFKNAIAQTGIGQASDVIKEIRGEIAAMKNDVSVPTVDTSTMENELESIDDRNESQVSLLEQLLDAITFGNQMFQDQMTDAAAKRAQEGRAKREAELEAGAQIEAIEPSDEEVQEKKGFFGKIFDSIGGIFGKLLSPKGLGLLALGGILTLAVTKFGKDFENMLNGLTKKVGEALGFEMSDTPVTDLKNRIFKGIENAFAIVEDFVTVELPEMFKGAMRSMINSIDFIDEETKQKIIKELGLERRTGELEKEFGGKPVDVLRAQLRGRVRAEDEGAGADALVERQKGMIDLEEERAARRSNIKEQLLALPSDKARKDVNRIERQLRLKQISPEKAQAKFETLAAQYNITPQTSQIADESGTATGTGGTTIINNNIDQRKVVTDQSRTTAVAGGGTGTPAAGIQ